MANVKMEELARVQTVGPGGIGVYPPVPTEKVDKVSSAGLGKEELQRSANVLPHPGAVDDGAVMQEIDGAWSGGQGGGGSADIDLGVTDASVGDYLKVKSVDEDGKPTAWESEPVDTETIVEATDAWLEENVAQETGYVLDSTLTMSNAAAPADKVGELKTAITQLKSTSGIVKTIENVAVASFTDGTNSRIEELLADVTAVEGETGWTSANITITGKNLLNLSADKMISYSWNRRFPIEIKEAGTYTLSAQNQFGPASRRGAAVNLLDANYQQVLSIVGYSFGSSVFSATFTLTTRFRDVKYLQFAFNISGATFADIEIGNIQIEKGTVATAYENFGSITTITFPTEAGEVTSGTIDAISKKLIIGTTEYPLEIPDLKTLDGENNIWVNTGNINEITYYTSNKEYIDDKYYLSKALIATELPNMVADTALHVGDFRVVGDTLYKVTADIASGNALVEGTNVVATNVGVNITQLDERIKESVSDIKYIFGFEYGDLSNGSYVNSSNRMATPNIQHYDFDIIIAKKNTYTSCYVVTFSDANGSNPVNVGIINDYNDYYILAGTYFRLLIYNPQNEQTSRGDKFNNIIYNDFRAYSVPLSESIVRSGSYKDTFNYNRNVRSVCHRGANRLAPENTLPAFILARKIGFDCVEADVAITHDNVPVILHDETIDRTSNGTGNIAELDYEDIENLDFGSWFSPQYAGTKIPTLAELLQLCRKIGLRLRLDINHTMTTEQLTNVCKMVIRNGMMNNTEFIGYGSTNLTTIKSVIPTATLIYLVQTVDSTSVETALALKTDINDVHLETENITENAINLCADALIPLEYWTAGSQQAIRNLDPYVTVITTEGTDRGVPLVAGFSLYKSVIN